jgi:hypothetical protein
MTVMKRINKSKFTFPAALLTAGLGFGAAIYGCSHMNEVTPKLPVKFCSYSYLVAGGGVGSRLQTRMTETAISIPEANKLQAAADKNNCQVELCAENKKNCTPAKTNDVGSEISSEFEKDKEDIKTFYGLATFIPFAISLVLGIMAMPNKPKKKLDSGMRP